MASRSAPSSRKVPGKAQGRVNQPANPPTRVKPRPAPPPSSRAPNLPLKAASLRPKAMVPSDRLGEFADWKTIEVKRRPDGRLFIYLIVFIIQLHKKVELVSYLWPSQCYGLLIFTGKFIHLQPCFYHEVSYQQRGML